LGPKAKQRHLCTRRLHLNQVKLRLLFRPSNQRIVHNIARTCRVLKLLHLKSLRLIPANRSPDRSSPSVHDYPSINSRDSVAKKVTASRMDSSSRGLIFAHVLLWTPYKCSRISTTGGCLEPSVLAGDIDLVIFGCRTRQMGRRNGGLVNNAHGDGSTLSSIRVAVNDKTDSRQAAVTGQRLGSTGPPTKALKQV
jgi:hypothetical protein